METADSIALAKADAIIDGAITRLARANNPHMVALRDDLTHDLMGLRDSLHNAASAQHTDPAAWVRTFCPRVQP